MSISNTSLLHFPEPLSEAFFSLPGRGFMTPNMLSEAIGKHLLKIAALAATKPAPKPYKVTDYATHTNHHFKLERAENGAQTLIATIPHTKEYQIYFAGNAQDALDPTYILETLKEVPNKNHIFWDYPGASRYHGITRFDPLLKSGYQQIKALLDSGVPAEKITLHGYSLGGGIASYITQKLHHEGHPVNLTVERSFSSLSGAIAPLLYYQFNARPELKEKYGHHLPLGSSIAAFATMGVATGTGLAGLIASVGVILTSLLTAVAYLFCYLLALIPGFKSISTGLNLLLNSISSLLNTCFDIIASVIGSVVAFAGVIAGTLVGAVVGLALSLQLLFTKNPVNIPLNLPTRVLLNTTTGEMFSVKNILSILSIKNHGDIKIINAKKDDVVLEEAALNTGLGFTTRPNRLIPRKYMGHKLSSFWDKEADHVTTLKASGIDDELTYTCQMA
ncbi:MAG: hypothetical protein P1U32_02700 [Legionellaceae bacterium]|nr:hypothetical protein [Legionellaceae bacterium]